MEGRKQRPNFQNFSSPAAPYVMRRTEMKGLTNSDGAPLLTRLHKHTRDEEGREEEEANSAC